MVQLTRIYTRGGDKGKTSLGDGTRVSKSCLRIEAIGTVDEANAALGIVAFNAPVEIQQLIQHVQNDLFDAGADLCIPSESAEKLSITQEQVTYLETCIDHYNAALDPLKSFILPGGSAAASHMHLARTIIRRAERIVAHLAQDEKVNVSVLHYMNRLSDLAFVLCRTLNDNGKQDILWQPGANRKQTIPSSKT